MARLDMKDGRDVLATARWRRGTAQLKQEENGILF